MPKPDLIDIPKVPETIAAAIARYARQAGWSEDAARACILAFGRVEDAQRVLALPVSNADRIRILRAHHDQPEAIVAAMLRAAKGDTATVLNAAAPAAYASRRAAGQGGK